MTVPHHLGRTSTGGHNLEQVEPRLEHPCIVYALSPQICHRRQYDPPLLAAGQRL